MQFLLAISIMLGAFSASAGARVTKPNKPGPKAPVEIPVEKKQVLVITVLSDDFEPVSGITVSAPCTGQKAMSTNKSGTATFMVNSSCHCDKSNASIVYDSGREQQLEVMTGTENIAVVSK